MFFNVHDSPLFYFNHQPWSKWLPVIFLSIDWLIDKLITAPFIWMCLLWLWAQFQGLDFCERSCFQVHKKFYYYCWLCLFQICSTWIRTSLSIQACVICNLRFRSAFSSCNFCIFILFLYMYELYSVCASLLCETQKDETKQKDDRSITERVKKQYVGGNPDHVI